MNIFDIGKPIQQYYAESLESLYQNAMAYLSQTSHVQSSAQDVQFEHGGKLAQLESQARTMAEDVYNRYHGKTMAEISQEAGGSVYFDKAGNIQWGRSVF